MARLRFSAFPLPLLAALQAGCAAMPERAHTPSPSLEAPRPTCDTSIGTISLAARIRNDSGAEIEFNLDGDRGPPYDPWYLGYRVHSSAAGEPYRLVHNSGHDSVWTRTVAIAPGNSADFNVPMFGLRPADYARQFRIELRDSKGRSYWTPAFELCAVSRANCGCPQLGALAANPRAPGQVCPAAAIASVANAAAQVEVGADCRR